MRITNNSGAPQGIQTAAGLVWLNPGQTRDLDVPEKVKGRDDAEVDNPVYKKLLRTRFFGIEGVDRPEFSPTLGDMNARAGIVVPKPNEDSQNWTERMTDFQRSLDSANDQLKTVTMQRDALKTDLDVSAARVSELETERDALIARVKELESPFKPGHLDKVTAGLDARHKGAGKYSVFSGESEVLTGLTKEQVDQFDALSDDRQKTDWVNAQAAAGSQE